ncbi:MAG: flavodoxin domain-containing protein [Anaerolineae bacterium]|nr:flavodoxin domain-containing protein [Anaerolineae bacterium]
MNIAIVYDSRTGTTAKAAEAMSKKLTALGHTCTVKSISQADPAEIANADVVCVGSWVEGLFVIMQHPTAGVMQFIERLGSLSGKKAVVFCTYKLAPGSTLSKMAKALEAKGASVVGQFKYRGSEPDAAFAAFADSLK